MNCFIELFGDLTIASVAVFLSAMIFIAGVLFKCYQFIVEDHDNRQEREETLKQVLDSLKEIQKEQVYISEQVKLLTEKQLELGRKQDKAEARDRAHNQNKLRDRLLQSYRFYTHSERNPMRAWSEMEKDAFDKLFQDYEEFEDENDFMQATVQAEMSKLEVIRMNDMDGLTKLAASRKG